MEGLVKELEELFTAVKGLPYTDARVYAMGQASAYMDMFVHHTAASDKMLEVSKSDPGEERAALLCSRLVLTQAWACAEKAKFVLAACVQEAANKEEKH